MKYGFTTLNPSLGIIFYFNIFLSESQSREVFAITQFYILPKLFNLSLKEKKKPYLGVIRQHPESGVVLCASLESHVVLHPLDVVLARPVVLQLLLDLFCNLQKQSLERNQ